MTARNGNFCAMQAAGLTRTAHERKPLVKWMVILVLAGVWLVAGLRGAAEKPPTDSLYQTLGALTMAGGYEDASRSFWLDVARFAGVALTAVGLLFGFSGAVGRAAARLWMNGAADHVVIAGEGPAALALARSCRAARDAVVLIARNLAPDTAWSLRQSGIVLIEGDPVHTEMLKAARAPAASHVVALTGDDAENLRVEAALRALTPERRRTPLAAHVGIDAPLLLMEAREMRGAEQRQTDALPEKKRRPAPVDPRPFALDEIAARALIVRQAVTILDMAESQKRAALHLLVFGFDAAAEAIAVRALMSLWSVRFGAPRVTIVAPDAEDADRAFAARYPQARTHDVWRADIAFHSFDWTRANIDGDFLDAIVAERGAPAAVVVSSGHDGQNIQLAFALLRTANRRKAWAAPIYMKETMQSEFSRLQASGDRTDSFDAWLLAFGAVEATATRQYVVDGLLDTGAAVTQRLYDENMAHRADLDMKKLEAMRKGWSAVVETYRNANRASADSALVKLWDAGWRPARETEHGQTDPAIDPALLERLSEVEHNRWIAERLLSGWRPGEVRDNRLMVHDDLRPWGGARDSVGGARDSVQVLAAAHAARAVSPRGFVRRT